MIGSATHLSFMDFIIHLTPIIILIVIVSLAYIYIRYRKGMKVSNERRAKLMAYDTEKLITDKSLLIRVAIVLGLVMVGFFLHEAIGLSPATIAMTGALIVLIISNSKEIEHILVRDVDWISIFFFIGLFIIVGGLKESGVLLILANQILKITHNNLQTTSLALIWFSGVLSAFVDNVPFVATMIPLIKDISNALGHINIDPLWWSLALGSCLGGNATMIGAGANIISVGIAKKNGFNISFLTYLKGSLILTVISLIMSSLYVWIRYFLLN